MRQWLRNYLVKKKKHKRTKYRSQSGITLFEIAIGLAVAAIAAASMAEYMADSSRTVRSAAVASKINEIYKATEQMVAENFEDLMDDAEAAAPAPLVIPVAKGAASELIDPNSLQGRGYLSPHYIDRNGYNQRHAVLIKKSSDDRLSILLTTWGGRPIEDNQLAKISGFVGSHGGILLDNPPTGAPADTILGSFGGWQTAAADWTFNIGGTTVAITPGNAMAHFSMTRDERGVRVNEFLHRVEVDGHEYLNEMETDLGMANNDITNINNFDARYGDIRNLDIGEDLHVDRNVTVGNDLTVANDVLIGGTLEIDGDLEANNIHARQMLSSGSGVETDGHLHALGDARVEGNTQLDGRVGIGSAPIGGSFQGSPNMLNVQGNIRARGGLTSDTTTAVGAPFLELRQNNTTAQNLFLCGDYAGDEYTGRRRLGMHQNRPACATTPRIYFDFAGPSAEHLGSAHFDGNVHTNHDLTAGRDLTIGRDAFINNELSVGSDAEIDGILRVNNEAVVDDIFIRNSGRWASDSILYADIVTDGATIRKPTCYRGALPHIFLSPVFFSDNGHGRPLLGVRAYATELPDGPYSAPPANYWRVRLIVYTPDASGTGVQTVNVQSSFGRMMALVKCHDPAPAEP